MYDAAGIRSLLILQSGVITRRQLGARGATQGDLQRFVRRGALHRRAPGVYVTHNGPLTPLQRAWCSCLRLGRAALADESALEMSRAVDGSRLTFPLVIAIPAHRSPPPCDGATVRRVAGIERAVAWNAGPPRMYPHLAALRVASRAPTESAMVGTLADAVNWRTTRVDRMITALDQLPTLPRRLLISDVLADLSTGASSVLEREYLRRVERAHGLPTGQRQAPRRTAGGVEFRDVTYDEYGLVVELDGRAFHTGKRAWDNDHQRDLDELVAGRRCARLGWQQVLGTSCVTTSQLVRLLHSRGWEGRPHACGPGCPLGRDR